MEKKIDSIITFVRGGQATTESAAVRSMLGHIAAKLSDLKKCVHLSPMVVFTREPTKLKIDHKAKEMDEYKEKRIQINGMTPQDLQRNIEKTDFGESGEHPIQTRIIIRDEKGKKKWIPGKIIAAGCLKAGTTPVSFQIDVETSFIGEAMEMEDQD